jgi:hypothetical protein
VAEATTDMTDQRTGEIKDPLRNTAVIHQITGQDKEGDSQEGESCSGHVHALRHHRQHERLTHKNEGSRRSQAHGRENRHTEHHHAHKCYENN